MKNSNFSIKDPRNLSILTDFYELTMANGFFQAGRKDDIGVFDLFFRKVPDNGGFAIAAGLEQAMDYLENLHFDDNDIEYLRSKGIFSEEFLAYFKNQLFISVLRRFKVVDIIGLQREISCLARRSHCRAQQQPTH